METQNKAIRKYLESGRKITPLDALYRFNCFRLSARIYDLRRQGMRILVRDKAIISGGKTKYIAGYYAKKENTVSL